MLRKYCLLFAAFTLLLGVLSAAPAASAESTYISPLAANPNISIRAIVDSKYYQLIVDKETQVVTALRRDGKGDYTIIDRQMVCSTGVPPRTYPGTFKISTKRRWLNSPPKNGRPQSYEQFACRFNDVIWFHATVFEKMDSKRLEPDSYLNLGKPVSAGCVRLCVRDALWIYSNCPAGTVVKVIKSGGPTPVCLEPLPPLPEGATYDPTDPLMIQQS
jgi:lipoprotein-anchoring transpeptidase ErfK/SrfK